MVLLDNIIQVFTLANLDTFVFVTVVLFDGRRIGTTFININETRLSVGADGFGQKASRRLRVSLGRQQKVDRVTLLVDRASDHTEPKIFSWRKRQREFKHCCDGNHPDK